MKIIDLLNKIANDEEVPEKIKINNIIFEYQGDDYLFKDKNNDNHEYWLFSDGYTDKFEWLDSFLKTEVEIIKPQEHKIPEKLNIDTDKLRGKEVVRSIDYLIEDKINEIIDYLEVNNDRER